VQFLKHKQRIYEEFFRTFNPFLEFNPLLERNRHQFVQ